MPSDTPNTSHEIPIGVWLRLNLPSHPDFIGFTYVDAQAGLSAKGGPSNLKELASQPSLTVRLPMRGVSWSMLSDAEIAQLSLPRSPEWLNHYGYQPATGSVWGQWRKHPKLQGRLHPEYPDDIQVLVHDGGPRLTNRRPELVWVRIIEVSGDIFKGTLLNQPQQLQTVAQHGVIQFTRPEGGEHALLVTEKYLRERPEWNIHACNKCGLTELFDAPTDLIKVVFPDLPDGNVLQSFTAFCGVCGGVQVVEHKSLKEAK